MKQNKYFSFSRFTSLFKQDLLLNHKTYLFTIAGLGIGAYAFCYFIFVVTKPRIHRMEDYIPIFLLYLLALGVLVGTSFPALKNNIKSSTYLLTPGSTFEKFLIQFLIRVVLLIPIALFLFWIGANLAKLSLIPNPERNFDPTQVPAFSYVELLQEIPKLRDKLVLVLSIFSIASIFFAGSAYFNKYSLVKTLISAGVGVIILLLSFSICSHIFFPEKVVGFDIHIPEYKIAADMYNVQLFFYAIGSLSWLFFLPLAYFKLKEKEV